MTKPVDSVQYLTGRIDAVTNLAASLVALLGPAMAQTILSQCAKLRERASQGEELSDYHLGYASIDKVLIDALKQAADAEKILELWNQNPQ